MSKLVPKPVRRPNFTSEEQVALALGIKARMDILYGKFAGQTVSSETKDAAWLEILQEVNAVGGYNRTLAEIHTKNKNMTTLTKKIDSSNRREMSKTGGGKANIKELTESQRIVLETIPESCIIGIPGGIDLHQATDEGNKRVITHSLVITPFFSFKVTIIHFRKVYPVQRKIT